MARKTIFVSDLTGKTIDEKDAAIRHDPVRRRTPGSGRARRQRRRGRRPGGKGDEAGAARPQAEEPHRRPERVRGRGRTAPASFPARSCASPPGA